MEIFLNTCGKGASSSYSSSYLIPKKLFLFFRRQFMIENPDDTNSGKVITVKKQLMFAIQIAYGLVRCT